jgi:hypothetical protein
MCPKLELETFRRAASLITVVPLEVFRPSTETRISMKVDLSNLAASGVVSKERVSELSNVLSTAQNSRTEITSAGVAEQIDRSVAAFDQYLSSLEPQLQKAGLTIGEMQADAQEIVKLAGKYRVLFAPTRNIQLLIQHLDSGFLSADAAKKLK